MLITRETDYALRILRALATGEQMTAGELSKREQVPQQFAYKIIKKLDKAGLVEVIRGAEGGCRMTADLETKTLYDLLTVMEEDAMVVSCMEPEYECSWRKAHGGAACGVHCQLEQVQQALDAELRAHTLHKILFGE